MLEVYSQRVSDCSHRRLWEFSASYDLMSRDVLNQFIVMSRVMFDLFCFSAVLFSEFVPASCSWFSLRSLRVSKRFTTISNSVRQEGSMVVILTRFRVLL